MKTAIQLVGLCLITLICGCAASGTHVLVGKKRSAIAPSAVKLYLRAPAKYEEIALLSGESRNAFGSISSQGKMDEAVLCLKKQAAKLGANGVLVGGTGQRLAGAVGVGTGTAYSGSAVTTPIFKKSVSGLAIYVSEE